MVEFWQEKLLDLQRGPNRRQMRRAKPNEPKRLNVLDINKVAPKCTKRTQADYQPCCQSLPVIIPQILKESVWSPSCPDCGFGATAAHRGTFAAVWADPGVGCHSTSRPEPHPHCSPSIAPMPASVLTRGLPRASTHSAEQRPPARALRRNFLKNLVKAGSREEVELFYWIHQTICARFEPVGERERGRAERLACQVWSLLCRRRKGGRDQNRNVS